MEKKASFFKEHGDTIAIIASTLAINLAVSAIMISMWITITQHMDTTNTRIDGLCNHPMILTKIANQSDYEIYTDGRQPFLVARKKYTFITETDHSKGFQPYEDRVPIPVQDWMIKDTKQGD